MAFLRVAILYDRDSSINFVSRIVREHLSRNWAKLYAPQVEAEDFEIGSNTVTTTINTELNLEPCEPSRRCDSDGTGRT
jgi:hypothetical protein